MSYIHAIYENGVFRPVEHIELPDPCEVEFEPRMVQPVAGNDEMDDIYAVLEERYHSGENDVAARHNGA